MTDIKVRVTIVGAGRYGRELIAPKYMGNKNASLISIISRTASEKTSMKAFGGAIIVRTAEDWKGRFGKPTDRDVFDIALFPERALNTLQSLAKVGAKNFILPKPVATTASQLSKILKLQKKHGLRIVVASQWHYSAIVRELGKIIARAKGGYLVKIKFSQFFSNEQIKNYTPTNALLPHLLQIAYSTGALAPHKKYRMGVSAASQSSITVTKALPENEKSQRVMLLTDIRSEKRERSMKIYDGSGKKLLAVADFLSKFENGRCIKPLTIYKGGAKKMKKTIAEDTLGNMVDAEVRAFKNKENFGKGKNLLTLERYMPVIKDQIMIENAYRRIIEKNHRDS